MGIIRGVLVLILILLIISYAIYPEETTTMLKSVGYVVVDFTKERANDLEKSVEEKISSELSLSSSPQAQKNS